MSKTVQAAVVDDNNDDDDEMVIAGELAPWVVDLPKSFNLPIGKGSKFGNLNIRLHDLPMVSRAYIVIYGIRRAINDGMAGLDDEDKLDKAQAKLDALYDGTTRMRGSSLGRNAVEVEAYKEAEAYATKRLRDGGYFKNIPKGTRNQFMFVVNRIRTERGDVPITKQDWLDAFFTTQVGEGIWAAAEATVEARKRLAPTIDLDGLV